MSKSIDEQVDRLETAVDPNTVVRELRKEVDTKIKNALDNPLAN